MGYYNAGDRGNIMSLVICVCNVDYSVMVGDGRMIEFDTNGKQIRVVNENTQKVFKVNDFVSVGYAGDPIPAVFALKTLENFDKNMISLELTAKIIQESLMKTKANELGVKIVISGRNQYGNMVLYLLNTKFGYEYRKFLLLKNNPVYSCLAHDQNKVAPILTKYINESIKGMSETKLRACLKKCIEEVSEVDDSVNKNIKEVIIK